MTKYSVNILCIIVGLKEQVSCVHMTFRLISPTHVPNPNKYINININIYIYKYDILLTLARVITTLSCPHLWPICPGFTGAPGSNAIATAEDAKAAAAVAL